MDLLLLYINKKRDTKFTYRNKLERNISLQAAQAQLDFEQNINFGESSRCVVDNLNSPLITGSDDSSDTDNNQLPLHYRPVRKHKKSPHVWRGLESVNVTSNSNTFTISPSTASSIVTTNCR